MTTAAAADEENAVTRSALQTALAKIPAVAFWALPQDSLGRFLIQCFLTGELLSSRYQKSPSETVVSLPREAYAIAIQVGAPEICWSED